MYTGNTTVVTIWRNGDFLRVLSNVSVFVRHVSVVRGEGRFYLSEKFFPKNT